MTNRLRQPRSIATIVLVLCIILSITVVSPFLSNATNHKRALATISESKANATALSLTVTLASTAISLLPDDTGSAIADELSELSTPLLIIVCILFFEQYLLTAMESLAFSILLPITCALFISYLYLERKSLKILALKCLLISLLCAIIIPLSAELTIMMRSTFSESLGALQAQLDEISITFSQMLGEGSEGDVLKFISNFTSGVGDVLSFAKDALGLMIDAVAILLITSCVIPVITLLLFIWCIKGILAGKMENLEDTAMSVIKKLPTKKKAILTPEQLDDPTSLSA